MNNVEFKILSVESMVYIDIDQYPTVWCAIGNSKLIVIFLIRKKNLLVRLFINLRNKDLRRFYMDRRNCRY